MFLRPLYSPEFLVEEEEKQRIGDSNEKSEEVEELHDSKEIWLHVSSCKIQNKPEKEIIIISKHKA